MLRRLFLIVPMAICLGGCPPQQAVSSTSTVEGAWRLVALTSISVNSDTTAVPLQESLVLFANGYYSMAYATGTQRSPFYATRFTPTDEESLARMKTMTVNTGTFEFTDSTMTLRPQVARVPEFVGGFAEHRYALHGDTLMLHWGRTVGEDGVEAPGGGSILTLVRIR